MDLEQFFSKNNKCALAFSGGVDSAYLLYVAVQCGVDIRAYYVASDFHPAFELERARRIADSYAVDLRLLDFDVLNDETICENSTERCYFCKKNIFQAIIDDALQDGYTLLMDGTNASDDFNDRPGMRVLSELGVRSPLREAGLTKEDIRTLSKKAGLETWNEPSYSCLATRIRNGVEITKELLLCVNAAEEKLYRFGYRDFRVRTDGKNALVQIKKEQLSNALKEQEKIIQAVEKYFGKADIDKEGR